MMEKHLVPDDSRYTKRSMKISGSTITHLSKGMVFPPKHDGMGQRKRKIRQA